MNSAFFQPKNTRQIEASNVFFATEVEISDERNDDLDLANGSLPEYSGGDTSSINVPSGVRNPIASPWAFK